MSGDVVARARESLQGVTDGPWRASKQREGLPGPRMPQPYVYPGNIVSDATGQIVFTQTGNATNSQFVAEARSLVPELLAEVEKLRGAMETIQGHCIDLGRPLHHIIGDILAVIERAGIEP